YENQTVRTGNLGMADLVFVDKTNLNVGPRSEVRFDKFVYDPNGSGGSVVMQATHGTFRFVTGSQAHEAYRVSTPHGTLGVHGTTVEFLVNKPGEECVTKLRLVEGEAEYKAAKTGQVARLTDPNKNNVACINASGQVTYSTSSTSIVAGLGESSTPPPPPGVPGGTTPIAPPPITSPSRPL